MPDADVKSAKAFAEMLSGSDAASSIKSWVRGTGVANAVEVEKNLSWLAASLKGNGIQPLLELYLAGVGAGKAGVLTLNRIALDMQAAGIQGIDASALERFMKYVGGDASGKRRMSVGAAKNFGVEVALKFASAKKPAEAANPRAAAPEKQVEIRKPGLVGAVVPQKQAPEKRVESREQGVQEPVKAIPLPDATARPDSAFAAPAIEKVSPIAKEDGLGITKRYTQGVVPEDKYFADRQELLMKYLLLFDTPIAKTYIENMKKCGEPRPNGEGVELLVIHYSGAPPGANQSKSVYSTFRSYYSNDKNGKKELNKGAHFLINEEGQVVQLAPISTVACHAIDFNLKSIGIEIAAADAKSITPAQLKAATELCADLMRQYPQIKGVAGHDELKQGGAYQPFFADGGKKPQVKIDPGPDAMSTIREGLTKKGITQQLVKMDFSPDLHITADIPKPGKKNVL